MKHVWRFTNFVRKVQMGRILWRSYSGSPESTATRPIVLRQISLSEAWCALRPFLFATHPTLFAQYPEMRGFNERSLLLLESFLEGLYHPTPSGQGGWPTSLQLQFYIQPRGIDSTVAETPRIVDVNLRDVEPYSVVKKVLESCELPTAHLPSLTESLLQQPVSSRITPSNPIPEDWDERDESELRIFWEKKIREYRLGMNCLTEWLEKLREEADEARRRHLAVSRELQNEVEWLCERSGIESISWDPDWPVIRCKAYLLALRRLLDCICPVQKGQRIKFAGGTGSVLSWDGTVILDVEDIPVKWLQTLVQGTDNALVRKAFEDLPDKISQLSAVLNGAKITCSDETSVFCYLRRVEKLLGIMNDRRFLDGKDLRSLKFVVQREPNSLLVGYNGEIYLPCNTSLENLEEFVKENEDTCRVLEVSRKNLKGLVEKVKSDAVNYLYLWDLTSDKSLRLENVLECVERLLHIREKNSFVECGLHISRTKGFQVLSDGKIKIPIEWEI